ncbi:hypothetical protein FBU30_010034 [Linnemannia zychae]|nr:hypothetical protein FBU30_010034 [Linnemannia zychae]
MSAFKFSSSKLISSTTSASNTPSGSRRNSTDMGHAIDSRTASIANKSLQQIRDEMMTIMMSKGMFTSPSQPFVL